MQYITLIASQPGTPDFFPFVKFIAAAATELSSLLSILVIASCDPRGRSFGKLVTCVFHMQMFDKSLRLVSEKNGCVNDVLINFLLLMPSTRCFRT